MNDKVMTSEEYDLRIRQVILRRNLEAASIERRAEGLAYCYRELNKVAEQLKRFA